MSKVIIENKTALEIGQRIQKDWTGFELVVVQPVKGKAGKLVFSATIHAENINAAVKTLREQIDGSGLIVLQKAAFSAELPIMNTVIADKLRVAYEKKFA